ncbi:MAG: NAD-dependent epimerase/dehydratase family protein [Chloroflexi bacterium]|nr:NAD-dependent epimerase/dehydratase family protein [Chloroflexota bacterium]
MTKPNHVQRLLITGGAGFIGANLIRLLLTTGYEITVLDNLSTAVRDRYLAGLPIRLVQGDILNANLVNDTVAGHDAVIHLAAQTGVPGSIENPRHDCEVNVIGTFNLLEASRKAQVKRFIFASSNAPLGRQPPPATEDKAPLPISPYAASKLAGEGYCLAYHGSWGLGTIVLRFANLYGPFSRHKESVVAKFFKDIVTEGQLVIYGDGRQTRDFIYVTDLCRAVQMALISDISGEIFQIATGQETTIQELSQIIQTVSQREAQISHSPSRRGDIKQNFSQISKAESMLKWKPTVSLHEGLTLTWDWFINRER